VRTAKSACSAICNGSLNGAAISPAAPFSFPNYRAVERRSQKDENMKRTTKAFLTAALATTLLSGGAMAATNLTGAGGTAIYPVLQVWAQKYQQKNGSQVNYQAIGSGGGIKQIESKTVDFANSESH
jgi:ABC-type phosphate transport system substrate-binding protein